MAILRLGTVDLWKPDSILYELTGSRSTYVSNECGGTLDSVDLIYDLYLSRYCTLSEAQEVQATIEAELARAPNLTLIRQETPDALIYRNTVRKGTLDVASDQNKIRLRFGGNRTLAFTLTLTIVPESGATAFRILEYLELTAGLDWANDNIDLMLFDEDSTAPLELYVETMDGFVDLSECGNGGYARMDIDNRDVQIGSIVEPLYDNPVTAVMANAVKKIAGGVVFQNLGSDATSIPLVLIMFEPFDPGGLAHTIVLNLSRVF